MKQLIALLVALVLVVSVCPAVRADVLYLPMDEFWEAHQEECTRLERSYRALTSVTVYESPESDKEVTLLEPGEQVFVSFTYEDARGYLWGYYEDFENRIDGWLPLAYMELVYDYISFNEEFGEEFLTLDKVRQLPEEYRKDVVMFWEYPGSESAFAFDMGQWAGDYFPEYDTIYKDPQGRRWGYVGYYMGNRHFWICLDHPTADYETLYAGQAPHVTAPRPDRPEATLPEEEIRPQAVSAFPRFVVATAAVGLCVGITAGLLVRMKKKGK